jgi:hypothetical protein
MEIFVQILKLMKRNRPILNSILSMTILFTGCLGGCVTAQKIDLSTSGKYEGFIHDGATAKQEIQDRLGSPHGIYENGRIFIYHVYLLDDGRMNLKGDGTCHACVLVFDKNDVLERHSLVKHGCR